MIVVQKFICNLGEDEEKGGKMASVGTTWGKSASSSTRLGRNFFPGISFPPLGGRRTRTTVAFDRPVN